MQRTHCIRAEGLVERNVDEAVQMKTEVDNLPFGNVAGPDADGGEVTTANAAVTKHAK